MEDTLLLQLIQSISIVYIAIVCLTTYGIIQTISNITKCKVSRKAKSIISLIVGILTAILYICKLDASLETVLLSFLISTFGYDLLFKPMFKRITQRCADSKNV